MFTITILVALGETEIDDVDVIAGCICSSDQEVIWLDVSVDDSLLMDFLDTADELKGNQEHGLEIKVSLT